MARKPGIYEHVMDGLQPPPIEDPSQQERINNFKTKIREKEVPTATSLALDYRKLREGIGNPIDEDFLETLIELLGDEGICALKSECDMRMEAYEQMLVASHDGDEPGWGMYGASEHTVRLPDGGSVSVQREPMGKVMDKEKFRLWCIKDGLENSLQLWPSTMNAIVKKRILNGESEPDGVEAFSKTKIVLRKG